MRWGEAASTEMPWEQAITGGGWQLSADDTCFLAVAPLILTTGVLFYVLPLLWGIWEIWVLGLTVPVPGRGPMQLLWGQNFLFFFPVRISSREVLGRAKAGGVEWGKRLCPLRTDWKECLVSWDLQSNLSSLNDHIGKWSPQRHIRNVKWINKILGEHAGCWTLWKMEMWSAHRLSQEGPLRGMSNVYLGEKRN